MRRLALPALLGLAACSIDPAPVANIPAVCEDQVYADPKVKFLIMEGAGSPNLARNTEDQLRFAKIDAARRCMQQKGLARPGGGVERPRINS